MKDANLESIIMIRQNGTLTNIAVQEGRRMITYVVKEVGQEEYLKLFKGDDFTLPSNKVIQKTVDNEDLQR